jgi:hypothetical protein
VEMRPGLQIVRKWVVEVTVSSGRGFRRLRWMLGCPATPWTGLAVALLVEMLTANPAGAGRSAHRQRIARPRGRAVGGLASA